MRKIRRNRILGFSVLLVATVFIIYTIHDTTRLTYYATKNHLKHDNFYYYGSFQSRGVMSYNLNYENLCPIQLNSSPSIDIQMLNLYNQIKFDNPDGGVWKQGWEIEKSSKEFDKLKVFVVPHSHNDAGWEKTADDYYVLFTKNILDNMVEKLVLDIRRKFIWAEMLYFAKWWENADDRKKYMVKKFVENNQLEFVCGGWVMNDEADSHWVATVGQFIEGHQWLKQNLNYTPRTSWSIDPFGLSTTQALLLKKMGFENMVLQRVHYSVKKELARKKQLEFRWRQIWDGTGSTDIFTHIMPFSFYDITFTCGPDPKVCCQFDFVRLPGMGLECPSHLYAQNITEDNLVERAELLLSQYRKKSELFRTNALLVPIGDDFRFSTAAEWDLQYENYQKIFDYLNSDEKLNVEVKFATLSDYFDSVKVETPQSDFPVLTGDFFTYADWDERYWSGTYTSRQFYKRIDRILLSYIRAADILLVKIEMEIGTALQKGRLHGMSTMIVEARQVLSLFQHHDALSGTAHDNVFLYYGEKMLTAVKNCQKIIQEATELILSPNPSRVSEEETYYDIDDIQHVYDNFADHYNIKIESQQKLKRVVLFNSLTFSRQEVVTFITTSPFIEVLDSNYLKVVTQISPTFDHNKFLRFNRYQVSFVANVPTLGMATYFIKGVSEYSLPMETTIASVRTYNFKHKFQHTGPFENYEALEHGKELTLRNDRISAVFNPRGTLEAVYFGQRTIPIKVKFAKYNNHPGGPHLFLPRGSAIPITKTNVSVIVVQGPVFSSVTAELPYITHTTTLYNSSGADGLGIDIQNIVNTTGESNVTLVMKVSTDIKNGDVFFSDSNGYQFLKRKALRKIPIQGNFYPMPLMSYIEDESTRMSVITDTPVGVASLDNGQLEVTLDQKSKRYNKSIPEDVHERSPIFHNFKLLVEVKDTDCQTISDDYLSGFPTISSSITQRILLNPIIRLISRKEDDFDTNTTYVSYTNGFGIDYSMPLLRPLYDEKNLMGIILHRHYLDLCFADRMLLREFQLSNGEVDLRSLFGVNCKLRETSLSFLSQGKELDINKNISLCPMDVQAFTLEPH